MKKECIVCKKMCYSDLCMRCREHLEQMKYKIEKMRKFRSERHNNIIKEKEDTIIKVYWKKYLKEKYIIDISEDI